MELHGREQVQAQTSDHVETTNHVPEQIRDDRVPTGEGALARTAGLWRIDFLGDHNAIVRLFVIDVRTLPRSAWFASRLFRA